MKIIKIYSGFFIKNFFFKSEDKFEIWNKIIFKSWYNTYRWIVKNTFKDWIININNFEEFTFIRKCNEEDLKDILQLKDKEKEFLKFFSENYKQFKITLEPNTCELSFDDKMLLFSYTANEKVDFRELVKFLASKYHRRIQLKHIWWRDKAATFWWFWVCWRELCCSKFLKTIPSVPIHAPKIQDLMYKDSENLLWVCWKLKCCLNYEVEQYQEIKKNMPRIWNSVFVDWKKWIIIWVDIFSQKIKLKFSDSAKIYDLSEIKEFLEKNKSEWPGSDKKIFTPSNWINKKIITLDKKNKFWKISWKFETKNISSENKNKQKKEENFLKTHKKIFTPSKNISKNINKNKNS